MTYDREREVAEAVLPSSGARIESVPAATDGLPSSDRSSLLQSFLRFGGLSGLGWLLDFGLLYLLVRFARLPVFTSNLISATTAATIVFLLSRKLVFRSSSTFVLARVLFYCGYTLAVIVVASIAMKYVTIAAGSLALQFHHPLATSTCAMIAKVIVTPANFLANFVVARFTSEHGPTTP